MALSDCIRRIRRTTYLTQAEFAKRLGVSFTTVNRWETGKAIPNLKTLKQIDSYCKENEINIDISKEME